ncbi:MAG: radical SAM protein [Candidatus Eiseniibacteriota bacterium]|nr:MAG: radical SAM protein [Candidatus Eisenbacteria bacterium]
MSTSTRPRTSGSRIAGRFGRKKPAPEATFCGETINDVQKGLPRDIRSVCPECTKVIDARLFEEGGKVYIEKTCPEHGHVRDLYWSDVEIYLKAEKWAFSDGRGLQNPRVKNATRCPDQCGLCNRHTSHTGLGNIDLTNRCDLTCPICFANANVSGFVYEPSYEEVLEMLKVFRAEQPVAGRMIQFSGGEPTLHPRFLDILRATKKLGFSHIQIASNGLNLTDSKFAEECGKAGLHTVYLQFDGTSDEVYRKTRGKPLFSVKEKAIESIRRSGMKIVFVPTVVKGFNDCEVGKILLYAIENIDVVSGISYQPVAFTGRISRTEREEKRYTLTDLAWGIEKQTGLAKARRDWYPTCCIVPFTRFVSALQGEETVHLTCHPHCSLATYLFVSADSKEVVAAPEFVDVESMFLDLERFAYTVPRARLQSFARMKAFNSIKKHFREDKAPKGLTFATFLVTLQGLMNKRIGRVPGQTEQTYKTLLLGGMHFMDAYNYDVDRARRCVVHYGAPGGRMYPFCTYNAGPTFRDVVEKKHSKTLEEWRRAGGAGVAASHQDGV